MVTDYNKNIDDLTVSKDMSSSSTRVAEQAGKEGSIVRRIDRELLDDLSRHTRKLGIGRCLRSMGYERCGELPLIVSRLKYLFDKPLKYLDIGSGESIFPSYLLKRTKWDISCLDKFSWVQRQHALARRVMGAVSYRDRLHVIERICSI